MVSWYSRNKKKKDKLVISYMSKADKKGKVRTFPECAGKSCYKSCYKSLLQKLKFNIWGMYKYEETTATKQ